MPQQDFEGKTEDESGEIPENVSEEIPEDKAPKAGPEPEAKKTIRNKFRDGMDKAQRRARNVGKQINVLREHSVVKHLINFFILVFILALVLIISYIIYKLYHSYPRPLLLGHSHDLENEMQQNVGLIVRHLYRLKAYFEVEDRGSELAVIINNIFSLGIVPEEDSIEFTPDIAPYIYFNFMFKRALSGDEEGENWNRWKLMELNLIKRLSGLETLDIDGKEENIYTESETEVRPFIASHIRNKVRALMRLENYFGALDCAYKSMGYDVKKRRCDKQFKWCKLKNEYANPLIDPQAEMARLHLSLLIYRYSPNVERMYDFRKSGGLGNFIVYNIFMADYIQFIFKEQIPSIWNNFIERVKVTGGMYARVVGSETVANYMARLPMTLAGVERFEDAKSLNTFPSIPSEDVESYQKIDEDEKVTEHFIGGLVNLIKGLMQLIPNILKLVMALLTAITNPIQIIRIILSIVIGLIIYILYVVLVVISPLFYIPAFIYVLSFSLIATIAWLALFIAIAIIFFILWILDYATNGLIFMWMRCENPSDAWHRQPNYAFGNIYQRYFVCNYPCGARYTPKGWFCERTSRFHPTFCPQQLIMNAYVHHELGGRGEHSSLESAPLFYDFTADLDYISGDDEYKKNILSSFYRMQKQFSRTCDENLAENSFITGYFCNHLDLIMADKDISEAEMEKLRTTCYKCFCKHYYLKAGCRMSQRPYIKVLALHVDDKVESKYLYDMKKDETDSIIERLEEDLGKATEPMTQKQIRKALRELKKNIAEQNVLYIVNDGFENDPVLKKKKIFKDVIHLPKAGVRYKFCESFFDEEEPQLAFERRKRGQILYYVIYALLLLIIISFGFIMLYQRVDYE